MDLAWVGIVLAVFLFGIGILLNDRRLGKHSDKILENNVKLEKVKQGLKEKPGEINFRPGDEPGTAKAVATRKKTFTADALIGSKEQRIAEKRRLEKQIQELGDGEENEKAKLDEKIGRLELDGED